MTTKRFGAFIEDFDGRYARWVAAQATGNETELNAAAAALPTLNKRLRAKLTAVDEAEPDPEMRAAQKRLVLLTSELQAEEIRRRRERGEAEKRHRERAVRVGRTVEIPGVCAHCGARLGVPKTTGRPRLYCSPACRRATYEDRRARRNGAVQVQIVEKLVTEIREHRVEVPHPRRDCIQAVLDDDDALGNVILVLIDEVRNDKGGAFDTDHPKFWDLYNNVEVLHEAIVRRARDEPR